MRLIDADEIIAWAEGSMRTVSPCEDQRDVGYLDCLENVMEIVKEEPDVEAVPLDALCKWLAHYCVAPVPTGQEPLKGIALNKIGWKDWTTQGDLLMSGSTKGE